MAERPIRFEHFQLARRQAHPGRLRRRRRAQDTIDDIVAAEAGLAFGPDTLPEARNRCYRPHARSTSGLAAAERELVEHTFPSGGLNAAGAPRPARRPGGRTPTPGARRRPRLPRRASAGADSAAASFPELGDRIASELGWSGARPGAAGRQRTPRATSRLVGWLEDIVAAIAHLRRQRAAGRHLAGRLRHRRRPGGLRRRRASPAIKGVAALGAPADFDDWASQPRRLLEHARSIGLIRDPGLPAGARPVVEGAAPGAGRPVHGDRSRPGRCSSCTGPTTSRCPQFDARVLADAHGDAELRMIAGAGHALRHDPRAVAVLLGLARPPAHRPVRVACLRGASVRIVCTSSNGTITSSSPSSTSQMLLDVQDSSLPWSAPSPVSTVTDDPTMWRTSWLLMLQRFTAHPPPFRGWSTEVHTSPRRTGRRRRSRTARRWFVAPLTIDRYVGAHLRIVCTNRCWCGHP